MYNDTVRYFKSDFFVVTFNGKCNVRNAINSLEQLVFCQVLSFHSSHIVTRIVGINLKAQLHAFNPFFIF